MTKRKPPNDLPLSKFKTSGEGIRDISKTVDLGPEEDLQQNCEDWLKQEKIHYLHISHAVYRDPKTRGKYLGVPDLMVFKKDEEHNQCLLVELKSLKGTARQGQKRWARGLHVYLLRSFQDFKELVLKFLD